MKKDNPVPSIDEKIEQIKQLLDIGDVFISNKHKLICFMGIRAILQNGVETNKEQPKIPKDYVLIHQSDEEMIFRKQFNKKCDCANQAKSCNNLDCQC